MNQGTMIYVTPNGEFRKKTVKVTDTHPNFLRNFRNNQSHPQEDLPTFPIRKPVPITKLSELMEPDPPLLTGNNVKWMAICEDNSVWPYCCHFITTIQEYIRRQRKRFDYFEEGVQYATANTIKNDLDQGWMTNVAVILSIGLCAFLILTALVIANFKFNQPDPATAVGLMALVGMVTSRRSKNGSVGSFDGESAIEGDIDTVPPPPKGPKLRCYVYDCKQGDVYHKVAPMSLIIDTYKNIHIYRYNLLFERLVFTLAFAAIVGGMIFMPMFRLAPVYLILTIVPSVLLAVVIGWFVSPRLLTGYMPLLTPFTCFYKWEPDESGPVLVPIRHTMGRGVDPMVYDLFKDEAIEATRKLMEERGIEGEVKYRPTVNRADVLHQHIDGRIQAAKRRSPGRISPKLQLGLLAVMCFASVGIFFFVAFATTGG